MKDNEFMGSILSFFAEHSPSIIKLLSVVVALAASVLLYRVIFAQSLEASAGQATTDLTEINKKLSQQKIEIDALKSENETSKGELEKQRTEVYNLRQTIKEKETEVESIKAENLQLKSQTDEVKKADYEKHKSEVILSTSDESLLFQKEIAELKRRLSDYEIIAEDISDMQRLKEENEKLKAQVNQSNQVGDQPSEPASEAVAEQTPVVAPSDSNALPAAATELTELTLESLAEVTAAMADQSATSNPTAAQGGDSQVKEFVNPSANAPADFVPNEKSSIDTETLGLGPGDDSVNVDQILAEAATAQKTKNTASEFVAVTAQTETLGGVSEVDKNLLDKFEKQKDS